MTTNRQKTSPMCIVRIGFSDYLMPADKGMKVVELMQYAIEGRVNYEDHPRTYLAGEPPEVEYKALRPDQIRMPQGVASPPPGSPKLLTKS